jgi:hypothetical protein
MPIDPLRAEERWRGALAGNDTELSRCVRTEDPADGLFVLTAYINGAYAKLAAGEELVGSENVRHDDVRSAIERLLPAEKELRRRLGWQQREVDLAVLQYARRWSALSLVLGAGVTMASGGPSWQELVRQLLEHSVETGHEIGERQTVTDTPTRTEFRRRIVDVERLTPAKERRARRLMSEIDQGHRGTEKLMRGAQLCLDLHGPVDLFRLLTDIIDGQASGPSAIHRAIAPLGAAQRVCERGGRIFPGWESIITYNFDGYMARAFADAAVGHVIRVGSGDRVGHIKDERAKRGECAVPIFHLHGYHDRERLEIVPDFVFATSQFLEMYGGEMRGLLKAIFENYLAKPLHVALYVGCSFTDRKMNDVVRNAVERYPGRSHYAFIEWPNSSRRRPPPPAEVERRSIRFTRMGVRPIWLHDHNEIPRLIGQLA